MNKPTPTPGPRVRDEGQDARDQLQAGTNVPPTKAPLQTRSASPSGYASSGMERALGAHADKLHPPKRRSP